MRGTRHVLVWLLVLATGLVERSARAAAEDDAADEPPDKKARSLMDKRERSDVRRHRLGNILPDHVLSLRNLWTHEVLPIGSSLPSQTTWSQFLRCHHTNQCIPVDARLLDLMRAAGRRFGSSTIEIVSGFRAPKYNLMLRKKGHQVARDSQHTQGRAIDFRVAGVPVKELRRFVLAQRLGGVGFYPHSQFIHADTGPLRTWTAE